MTRVRLQVMGDPVPMPRARIVRSKGGAIHGFTPVEAEQAKERIRTAARLVRVPFFVGPVWMEADFYLSPDGVTFWKRGSGDIDNLFKLCADALEGVAYANDSQVVHLMARKLPARDGRPGWSSLSRARRASRRRRRRGWGEVASWRFHPSTGVLDEPHELLPPMRCALPGRRHRHARNGPPQAPRLSHPLHPKAEGNPNG